MMYNTASSAIRGTGELCGRTVQ